jgi:hypothetical protein
LEVSVLGRSYYLTSLDAWQRSSSRFTSSHFAHANPAAPGPSNASLILAFVEADEGVHNALSSDPEWEALPHPMSNKPVSVRVAAALVSHGVTAGATTFDVADAVARAHPILHYRVF